MACLNSWLRWLLTRGFMGTGRSKTMIAKVVKTMAPKTGPTNPGEDTIAKANNEGPPGSKWLRPSKPVQYPLRAGARFQTRAARSFPRPRASSRPRGDRRAWQQPTRRHKPTTSSAVHAYKAGATKYRRDAVLLRRRGASGAVPFPSPGNSPARGYPHRETPDWPKQRLIHAQNGGPPPRRTVPRGSRAVVRRRREAHPFSSAAVRPS